MTISKERRLADQEHALAIMAQELGDESLRNKWWDIDRPNLVHLLPTTWAELTEKGLVRRHHRSNLPLAYELTEPGWVVGLKLSGVFDSDTFRARCLELVRFFKAAVKGREAPHHVWLSRDAVRERFPLFWVLNILRADVLQEMFPDKFMNAAWDDSARNIRVPVTFGMSR